jgi:hypothetical protein
VISERAAALVRDWGPRLKQDLLVERILVAAQGRVPDVQLSALDGLQRENAAFQRAAGEQFRNEALGHCKEISHTMFAVASGRVGSLGADPFSFVRLHAIRRARQQFPLAGSLNAYRLAHKGYWTVMREQIVALARDDQQMGFCSMLLSEFLIEFFDVISGILTDAYLAEEQRLIAQRLRARVALIEDLLSGRPPGDLETREISERYGIRESACIAVAVIRPMLAPDLRIEQEAALARLAEVVENMLSAQRITALVERRDAAILAISAGAAGIARGKAAAFRAGLVRRRDELPCAVAIGIGLEAAEITSLPQSYQEAERAAEFAEPRRPVVNFADIDLIELLLRRPDRAALRLIPEWAVRLREADSKKSGDLLRTVRAFTASDLNVKRTARHLKLHTNTVYFRLNRIKRLTGVDPRSFSGASLLLTAMRMLDVKPGESKARQ